MGDLKAAQASRELRDFIQAWSDLYDFTFGQGMWHVRRRDNGAVLHVAAEDLCQKVMEDYAVKPVRMKSA